MADDSWVSDILHGIQVIAGLGSGLSRPQDIMNPDDSPGYAKEALPLVENAGLAANAALLGKAPEIYGGISALPELIGGRWDEGLDPTIAAYHKGKQDALETLAGARGDVGPIANIADTITGAIASPVNSIPAVKAAYETTGLPGILARIGVNSAIGGATGAGTPTGAIPSAIGGALFSPVADLGGVIAGKVADAGYSVLKKGLGLTIADYVNALKGTNLNTAQEGETVLDNAIQRLRDNGQLGLGTLAQGNSSALGSVADSIDTVSAPLLKSRDNILENTKALIPAINPDLMSVASKISKLQNDAQMPVAEEVQRLFDGLRANNGIEAGAPIPLDILQAEKEALNKNFKADPLQQYADTLYRQSIRQAIETAADAAATQGAAHGVGDLAAANAHLGELAALKSGVNKDYVKSFAEDPLSAIYQGFHTTGGANASQATLAGGPIAGLAALFGKSGPGKRVIGAGLESIGSGLQSVLGESPVALETLGQLPLQDTIINRKDDVPQAAVTNYVPVTQSGGSLLQKLMKGPGGSDQSAPSGGSLLQKLMKSSPTATSEKSVFGPVDLNRARSIVSDIESRGNPSAINPKDIPGKGHAKGLFQFMDSTAQEYGIDPLNADQATSAFDKMYSKNLSVLHDPILAMAAHNRGLSGIQADLAAAHTTDPRVLMAYEMQHVPETGNYLAEILKRLS